ncbi:hypothetical protein LshimejAT787_1202850 [Lyophyllum shimeji]|uniref:Uncharacterized protein n=1 Tax=Lyophyllum shimeji TaxID=47721 RepID=A0A9P3UU51_LYOSH|nr:hypothetical protein LshimejAT787_1202850 [Lyophyllum shimeji]
MPFDVSASVDGFEGLPTSLNTRLRLRSAYSRVSWSDAVAQSNCHPGPGRVCSQGRLVFRPPSLMTTGGAPKKRIRKQGKPSSRRKYPRHPMPAHLVTRFEADHPLRLVSYLSTFTCTAVFTLSLLDLGALSLYTAPLISFLTVLFHLTYLMLRARNKLTSRSPHTVARWAMLAACAYILFVAWFWPYGLVVYEAAKGRPLVPRLVRTFVARNVRAFLVPQAVVIGVEIMLFGLGVRYRDWTVSLSHSY